MRHLHVLVLASIVGVALVVSASAERVTVTLSANDVTAVSPASEELGDYYLIDIDVPRIPSGRRLVAAYLELSVDVSARTVDDKTLDMPMLEVHMLSASPTGEIDDTNVVARSGMRRPVAVGQDRSVRIDITKAVWRFMETPAENRGLVIGSLRGERVGLFELKSVGGALARITYLYAPR